MRTHYNNGDEIDLKYNGCDGCDVCTVNGIITHEMGCPDAWRDYIDDFCDDDDMFYEYDYGF